MVKLIANFIVRFICTLVLSTTLAMVQHVQCTYICVNPHLKIQKYTLFVNMNEYGSIFPTECLNLGEIYKIFRKYILNSTCQGNTIVHLISRIFHKSIDIFKSKNVKTTRKSINKATLRIPPFDYFNLLSKTLSENAPSFLCIIVFFISFL